MKTDQATNATPQALGSTEELGLLPEPAGFRMRYRSEPGMIGHYPWTYADQSRRRVDRPSCESEDLYTADQVRLLLAAERERLAQRCEQVAANGLEMMTPKEVALYLAGLCRA